MSRSTPHTVSGGYLFFQMLKIGAVSWGGFMALISVVQKQFAEKDKVIDNETVLDGIALASVLPGPVAFNVVTFIGYKLRGLKGAFLAMAGILLPSFILMIILSYLYFTYGNIPVITNFFKGIYPAIAAIILAVAIGMAGKNIRDLYQAAIALAALGLLIFMKNFFVTLIVMISGGILGYLLYRNREEETEAAKDTAAEGSPGEKVYLIIGSLVLLIALLVWALPLLCPASVRVGCMLQQKITLIFSGLSLSLFGGGYVVIPMLENVFVHHLEWLTLKEFADGIALGQVTPGPIFISATFIGYKAGGLAGALNATVSIFLPPALLMILLSHFLDTLKHSRAVHAVFKGLRPAVIGMIFSAVVTIARGAELSWVSPVIFGIVLLLVLYYRFNVVYIIPLAGIAGMILIR